MYVSVLLGHTKTYVSLVNFQEMLHSPVTNLTEPKETGWVATMLPEQYVQHIPPSSRLCASRIGQRFQVVPGALTQTVPHHLGAAQAVTTVSFRNL